jgi:7tm Odorant receptor
MVLSKLFVGILISSQSLFQILIPCYYGSEIQAIKSRYSSSIDYDKWIVTESKKDMLILQEVLKKPAKFQAGRIFDIDLVTFLFIVKSTYSLFTFLNVK